MIICASSDTQALLLDWLEPVEACFDNLEALRLYLQERLQHQNRPVPVFLDFSCIDSAEPVDITIELARLHVLSSHKLVLMGPAQQIDALPDTAINHLYTVLSLPLGVRTLQMLQTRLLADADRRHQLDAHEQRMQQLMEENRRLRTRLQQESIHDPDTGLYLRRSFDERLDEEWRRAHRHSHPISALAVRIQGIEQSDPSEPFLQDLVRRFKAVRSSDIVTRVEPDLFVLLLPLTQPEGAESLKRHFQDMMTRLIEQHQLTDLRAEVSTKTEIPRRHGDSQLFLKQLLTACCASPGREMLLV